MAEVELDQETQISLIVNAVYFDMPILVTEVIKRFPSFDALPSIDLLVKELISDKSIAEEEAINKLKSFFLKYYNQEIEYVPKSNP